MAQDGEDEGGSGGGESEGLQEDIGAVHQLWEAKEGGEDELDNAPIPFGEVRGGERWGDCGV